MKRVVRTKSPCHFLLHSGKASQRWLSHQQVNFLQHPFYFYWLHMDFNSLVAFSYSLWVNDLFNFCSFTCDLLFLTHRGYDYLQSFENAKQCYLFLLDLKANNFSQIFPFSESPNYFFYPIVFVNPNLFFLLIHTQTREDLSSLSVWVAFTLNFYPLGNGSILLMHLQLESG